MQLTSRTIQAGIRAALRLERLGDAPIHLQIEPTSHCNYDCLMCTHKTAIAKPAHMDFDRFEQFVRRVRPYHVTLSGFGEPLLHPKFFDMVRLLKSLGSTVNTTTNGFLLDRHIEDFCSSGIDEVSVSLDAATEESYRRIRRNEHFKKVCGNVRDLIETRNRKLAKQPRVRITFVIQRGNIEEIDAFISLASDMNVDGAYFQAYLNTEKDVNNEGIVGEIERGAVQHILKKADDLAESLDVSTNLQAILARLCDFLSVQYFATPRAELVKRCAKPYFSAYVSAEGNVRPCCSFASVPFNLGNAFETDIEKILNNEASRSFRRALRRGKAPHWLCARCVPESLSDFVFNSGW